MTLLLYLIVFGLVGGLFKLLGRVRALELIAADLQDTITRLDRVAHSAKKSQSDDERLPILEPRASSRRPATVAHRTPAAPRQEAVIIQSAPRTAPTPPTITAPAQTFAEAAPPPAPTPPPPRPSPPPPSPPKLSFEQIVGGKLPIWIGGAALVLAAFFLVRFSIEHSLLGPRARTIIAALFATALIAGSEVARRLRQTRDDPRIAQSLAGAGIASLYGTLYIAAQLYTLIGPLTAFVLMVGVTAAGIAMALRHGPPTAIMALIGGFAAPLVAGFDSAGIGPLLAYLGLLVAALFGLAIKRGWVWLALAACGGGFAWVNLLIASLGAKDLAGVGGFVLLLAIGATLALPRTGAARPWLRLLPLLAGLVQLLILAPALDFSPLAWGLYFLLSAATLFLAWRDDTLAPGAGAALGAILLLLAIGLSQHSASAPYAAIGITFLFGIPGHLRIRRDTLWTGIALAATGAPVLLANVVAHDQLSPAAWAALLALTAAAAATIGFRARDEAQDEPRFSPALTGGTALAALLAAIAAYELVPVPWLWPAWLALGLTVAFAASRTKDGGIALLATIPAIFVAIDMLAKFDLLTPYLASVFTAAPRPPIADLVAIGLLPPVLLAATARLLWQQRALRIFDWAAYIFALALIPAILPAAWHATGLALAALAAINFNLSREKLAAAALATFAATLPTSSAMVFLAVESLVGDPLPYKLLPPIVTILRDLTLPAALIGTGLFLRRAAFANLRPAAVAMVAAGVAAGGYALVKLPLAIATADRFVTLGLLERVVLTQLILLAAWLLRARLPRVAIGLAILGLARFIWFDLLILNPLWVEQSVGSIPVLNLATLQIGLIACWLWPRRHDRHWRSAMLAAVALTLAATVRQLTRGQFLTGPIGRTENWLYSAAFLGLALAWLTRGIGRTIPDLRIAGLVLLTAVTLKVFLIDASALEGILRIVSFLGLGLALMAIGWAYNRFVQQVPTSPEVAPGPDPDPTSA